MADYWVKCNVCKQRLKNWVGSTPCCGSIAFIVNDEGEISKKVNLYTFVGIAIIDFSEKQDGQTDKENEGLPSERDS